LISLGILSSLSTAETGKPELKPFLTILGTRMRAAYATKEEKRGVCAGEIAILNEAELPRQLFALHNQIQSE
jgi:hypothetical protein